MHKYLITGGTGSFGNAFLKTVLLDDDFSEIRIFSRDEKKQDDLRLAEIKKQQLENAPVTE